MDLMVGVMDSGCGIGASGCDEHGANLYDENGLIANETPDASAQEKCRELGRKLAAW